MEFFKRNKVILLFIAGVIVLLSILSFSYSLNHSYKETYEFLLYNILTSCFVSMMAAFVIMLFFDDKNKKNLEKRKKVLFKSLIYSINRINNVIGEMYKATSEKIEENDPILENIYYDKKKLLFKINKLDFYKKAPIYGKILWYEYLVQSAITFINEVNNIKKTYLLDIDDELLDKITKIHLTESMPDRYIFRQMEFIYRNKFESKNEEPLIGTLSCFIDDIHELMEYINKVTKKNNFILNKNICSDIIAPKPKSGLKDEN